MDIRAWVMKKKEILIIVGVFLFFLVLTIVGYNMRPEAKAPKGKEMVQVPVAPPESKTNAAVDGKKTDETKESKPSPTKGYFTAISPNEILKRIQEYGEVEALPVDAQVSHLPVGWVVYFFSLGERKENMVTVTFDSSETGFGANIICDIDLSVYPQFVKMQTGTKIWLAGTIEAVNSNGTGTFYIAPEYFNFDGTPPATSLQEN